MTTPVDRLVNKLSDAFPTTLTAPNEEARDVLPPDSNTPATAYAPVIRNLHMPYSDKEYQYELPPRTKRFTIHMRLAVPLRISFIKEKVADKNEPYWTIHASSQYYEDGLNTPVGFIIYFAHSSGTPGEEQVAEIIAWR